MAVLWRLAKGLLAVEVSEERRQSAAVLLIGDPASVVALAGEVDEGLQRHCA